MKKLAKEGAVLLLIGLLLFGSAPVARADTDLNVGGIAIVANTNGDAIMIRDGAGYEFAVIGNLGEGDIVTVVDGPIAGSDGNPWYKIATESATGFVFADFLVLPINAPLHPNRTKKQPVVQQMAATQGYSSAISGTGGDGARLRDGASIDAAILLTIPEGGAVEVTGDPQQGGGHYWYPVTYAGTSGWVAADFLGGGGSMVAATTTAPASSGTASFDSGAHVKVSNTGGWTLRLRDTPSLDGGIVGHADEGTVVQVLHGPKTDGAGRAWYSVDYDGLTGYAAADYLTWTDAALSPRVAAATTAAAPPPPAAEPPAPPAQQAVSNPPPPPAPAKAPKAAAPPAPAKASATQAPASSSGAEMAAFALKFAGYPYAWGGKSPAGFDCSGFTNYVARNVLGVGIGSSTDEQIGAGVSISAKELQPGDLVFFANTYKAGLSHVGIYIGGGQMISAASERTGVAISNIWDSYWGSRYYGARRLG